MAEKLKYGVIVCIHHDGTQKVRTNDNQAFYLAHLDRVKEGRLGDAVKLVYSKAPRGMLWYGVAARRKCQCHCGSALPYLWRGGGLSELHCHLPERHDGPHMEIAWRGYRNPQKARVGRPLCWSDQDQEEVVDTTVVEELLTPREVSGILGVQVATLYQWAASRRIPFVKVGKHLRFPTQAIAGWLAESAYAVAGEGTRRPARDKPGGGLGPRSRKQRSHRNTRRARVQAPVDKARRTR